MTASAYAFAIVAVVIYFAALVTLDALIIAGLIPAAYAHYLFVLAIGAALVFAASAYVTQHQTAALRHYLRQRG